MVDRFERFSTSLFSLTKCWNKIVSEEMKAYDLKGPCALYLLTMAHEEKEITAAKLADICAKDKADVSRSVTAMEKKGLVQRLGEAYRAKLSLTEKGREVVSQISERVKVAVELAGEGLTEENRRIFYDSLELIVGHLDEISKDGLPGQAE